MSFLPLGFVAAPQAQEVGNSTNPVKINNLDVGAGNSLEVKLGNTDGSTKVSFIDSASIEVASINDDGDFSVQDLSVNGNLTVSGTTTTINTEVQTADRFLLMNSEYISDTPLNSGIIFNTDPESTPRVVDTGGFSSTTVVQVDDASGLVAGDIILSQNPAKPENSGVFEVSTVDTGATPNTITIKSSPTSNLGLLSAFTVDTTVQGSIRKVSVQYIRSKTTGGMEIAFGDNAPALSFTTLATTTVSFPASSSGVTAGDIVVMNASGELDRADADVEATSYVLGISLDTATSANARVALSGEQSVNFDSAPIAGDRGKPVFLHTTAGQVSLTPPSGAGDTVIRIGMLTNHTTSSIAIHIGDPIKLAS